MARLLLVSTPLHGHFAPVASIAVDLVARGHDVTFITGPAFKADVRTSSTSTCTGSSSTRSRCSTS